MDITENRDLGNNHIRTKAVVSFPSKVSNKDDVKKLAKGLSKDNMHRNLEKLTSFHTRYYKSDYGLQSSDWVLEKVKSIIKDAGADKTVSAKSFPHSWKQHSVIATIPGKSNSTVVIGAHQDSTNLWLPSILPAPGADDDGSGTVTILEAFRALLESKDVVDGKAPNTIEFHWYSAEEGGLLGSQDIFKSYESDSRDVKAMLQQDMTGYVQGTLDAGKPESVGVITDYVDASLTKFIKTVIEEVSVDHYTDVPRHANNTPSTVAFPGLRPSAVTLAPTMPPPPRLDTPPPSLSNPPLRTLTLTSTEPTTPSSTCHLTTCWSTLR